MAFVVSAVRVGVSGEVSEGSACNCRIQNEECCRWRSRFGYRTVFQSFVYDDVDAYAAETAVGIHRGGDKNSVRHVEDAFAENKEKRIGINGKNRIK